MQAIDIRSERTTRVLFSILGVLLALHLVVVFSHLVLHEGMGTLTQLVDLDLESNLPTFFNAALFFLGAILLYLHGKAAEKVQRRGWMLMAGIFTFLGFDEGSQIHEKFMGIGVRIMEQLHVTGEARNWLNNAWVIPYLIILAVLVPILWAWFKRLTPALRKGLIVSGIVYVMGAVVMEMVGSKVIDALPAQDNALYPWMPCHIYSDPGSCWLYMEPLCILFYTLEELLEMTGLILASHVLLKAFEAKGISVSLNLNKAE